MRPIIIAACLFLACAEEQTDEPPHCGPRPPRPGYAAAFEDVNGMPRVLLTREDWSALLTWHDDVIAWADCIEAGGVP